jgi:hypothetical protein
MPAVHDDPGRTRRLRRVRVAAALAASVAGLAALATPSSPAGTGGPALLPDLVTLPVHQADLVVTSERGRRLLRFANEIGNRGTGPLEVFPSAASTNCDGDGDPSNDRAGAQRLFADTNGSGLFERGTDGVGAEVPFGCIRYHAAHDHWHVLRSAAYLLRTDPGGRLAASSGKVGFCHGDNRLVRAGPGVPPEPVYPFGSLTPRRCDEFATQGVSVGYADLYGIDVPGQHLGLRNVRDGRYCLVSRADPSDLLDESEERNNVRRTAIRLRPGRLEVKRLGRGC